MKIQHLASTALLTLALGLGACSQKAPEPTAAGEASPTATAEPAAAPEPATAAPAEPLKVGDPAPDVTLTLTDGTKVRLADLKGSRVLVYFYPKDDTPGCIVEAMGLRDAWPDLQAAAIAVYGVSLQDAESHRAFVDKYSLPFPLAIDDGQLAAAFQVPIRFGLTARQSFLVGADGRLEHVWREVSPARHAADVLAVVGATSSPK
ncbi:MAG: peroxiredoxin [Deltaproteobacteria bacterium]|nr:MAG: peroxiredoxin [Deltaproteobacteria bacterium]